MQVFQMWDKANLYTVIAVGISSRSFIAKYFMAKDPASRKAYLRMHHDTTDALRALVDEAYKITCDN